MRQQGTPKEYYFFIELARAIACMLITNSHFDGVYPWDISWGGLSRKLPVFPDFGVSFSQ